MIERIKKCKDCLQSKSFDCFSKHKETVDGLRSQCKSCVSIEAKLYREKNKDKINQKQAEYRRTEARTISRKTIKRAFGKFMGAVDELG